MEVLAYGPVAAWVPEVPGYGVVARETHVAAGYPLLFTQLRPSAAS